MTESASPEPPERPEWVNPDGTTNYAKLPDTFGIADSAGQPIVDSDGREVRIDSRGPEQVHPVSPEEKAFAAQAAAEQAPPAPSRTEVEVVVENGVIGGMAKAEPGPTNDHLQGKPREYIVRWLREHGLTPKY